VHEAHAEEFGTAPLPCARVQSNAELATLSHFNIKHGDDMGSKTLRARLLGKHANISVLTANLGLSSAFIKTVVRSVHNGALPLKGRRFAVFVTFTEMPYLPEYIYRHLDFLNANGFNVIVVSNSKQIDEPSLQQLMFRSIAILERPNIGYDFGAYRDGVLWTFKEFGTFDQLLLTNDSVFGPMDLRSDIFKKAFAVDADIVGLLDSLEICYHFQSFWLLFNRKVIASDKFYNYWATCPYFPDKVTVVRKMETKILDYFLKMNFTGETLFQVHHVTKRAIQNFQREIDSLSISNEYEVADADAAPETTARKPRFGQHGANFRTRINYLRHVVSALNHGVPMNPSIFMWRTLLLDMNFPYIKREIFTKNSVREPNILSAYEVTASCGYPVDLITNYLRGGR
jgi:hypothetical protein